MQTSTTSTYLHVNDFFVVDRFVFFAATTAAGASVVLVAVVVAAAGRRHLLGSIFPCSCSAVSAARIAAVFTARPHFSRTRLSLPPTPFAPPPTPTPPVRS